jgi:hypothetical protein
MMVQMECLFFLLHMKKLINNPSIKPPDEPLQPTAVVNTGSMPGITGLKNKVRLSTSLLMNRCLYGTPNFQTMCHPNQRECGVDHTRKQFNTGNMSNRCMPCQICVLLNIVNHHLEMMDRVLRNWGNFNKNYKV